MKISSFSDNTKLVVLSFAGALLFLILAIVGTTLYKGYHSAPRYQDFARKTFDSHIWKTCKISEYSQSPKAPDICRLNMVVDLLEGSQLLGRSRAEVLNILGEESQHVSVIGKSDQTCTSKDSQIGCWSLAINSSLIDFEELVLVIRFNQSNIVDKLWVEEQRLLVQ